MRAGHKALTNATVTVKAFDPFNISVGKHELQVSRGLRMPLPLLPLLRRCAAAAMRLSCSMPAEIGTSSPLSLLP